MSSDLQRDKFIQGAFGAADLDTQKGLAALLKGSALKDARAMTEAIKNAGGTIARDLPDAIDNSVDQVGRLKSALGEAADRFAQPINDVIKDAVKYLLDDKKISGTEMLVGGAAAGAIGLGATKVIGGLILSRLGGKLKGGLGGLGGLAGGSGPIPVYVVNNRMSMMPSEYGGGWQGGGSGGKTAKGAKAGWLRRGSKFLGRSVALPEVSVWPGRHWPLSALSWMFPTHGQMIPCPAVRNGGARTQAGISTAGSIGVALWGDLGSVILPGIGTVIAACRFHGGAAAR